DPSLAFVMGGGLIVGFFGLRLDKLLRPPLAAPAFVRGRRSQIDRSLVAGPALFGAGWGLAGFRPRPAIAGLGIVPGCLLPLVAALFAGAWLTGEVMEWSEPGTPSLTAVDAAAE